MQIQIIWPELHNDITLDEHHQRDSPVWFSPSTGGFNDQAVEQEDQVIFWLQQQQLMLCVEAHDYVCLIDGQPFENGTTRLLRGGMLIQIGHYLLKVIAPPADELANSLLPAEGDLPELELLINHGGHYTPYGDDAKQESHHAEEIDPLKSLTQEYKHYLLWGEQHHTPRDVEKKNVYSKRERLSDNLNVNECLKNKTVSECVVEAEVMMERVFRELMIDHDDIFETEQDIKIELLREIAPEHLKQIEKRVVSELLYRELYKMGLDSHL
ncbi:TagK domain-containing protein [Pantoea sp. NPDC088449]|uniref:TagK domain-containing protein n=1 Tax=Candidatus Pantoea floridensis TaxID=1938870 RepID=A0A286BQ69_9GAMM|nr:TagK domain-containing protein [Pantoea floridensis]PIF22965.1 hypothetical protein BX596_2397 [Enterobacteriaceae bacterium JKS000233]SOD36304.1 hypothetical protein SAMN06273570_0720 [Pantoea floridensis]HBZ17296.1 TagK domain-containing protein [Pantoea sp.]